MSNKDEHEAPELVSPEEGLGTLMAQMTRKWVDRIVGTLRVQRARGANFAALNRSLQAGLPNFDAHSRQRLLDLAGELPIPDDFTPETVSKAEQPKPNTIHLSVTQPPAADLGPYSLVRYQGTEWLVAEQTGAKWTLKLLE
ncbi:MAG: hypothetical protein AMXMBFR7_07870 [Planctomycetota bacterium]